jgi:DNA-binding CsgD family transcriptional regulator
VRNGTRLPTETEMIQMRRNGEKPASAFNGFGRLSDTADRAALKWLEREPTARLLVDRNLRILWVNDAAASALDAADGIRNCAGLLTTGRQVWDEELRGVVGRATCIPFGWTIPSTRADGNHIVLNIRKLSELEPATYGISFSGTGNESRAAYAPLERIFELTPIEHRTLLDLLDGHDAIAIARLRNVSVETIRTHIRSIYLKLEVRTREGLFHKLRPYQVWM